MPSRPSATCMRAVNAARLKRFLSYCGRFPAPELAGDPFGYKCSRSLRHSTVRRTSLRQNVVTATSAGFMTHTQPYYIAPADDDTMVSRSSWAPWSPLAAGWQSVAEGITWCTDTHGTGGTLEACVLALVTCTGSRGDMSCGTLIRWADDPKCGGAHAGLRWIGRRHRRARGCASMRCARGWSSS